MKIELIRLRGLHWATFRRGETSTVIGAQIITPDETRLVNRPALPDGPRMCFVVQFSDGVVDYVPIEEVINNTDAWEIVQ